MARPSNRDQRRHEIVQGLITVMAEHGYAKATIPLIAKQAGLTPGLIHYHFKTKLAILVELIQQVSATAEERYDALVSQATGPEEKLKAFIDAQLATGDGESPEAVAAWVVIGTEAIRQPEVREEYEKAIRYKKETLQTLLEEVHRGELSSEELEGKASIGLAAIEGAFQLSVAASGVMPEGYAANSLLALIL